MKTQTKLVIGLGLAALGYYLYKSKKLSTLVPSLAPKDTTPSKATDDKIKTTTTGGAPSTPTTNNGSVVSDILADVNANLGKTMCSDGLMRTPEDCRSVGGSYNTGVAPTPITPSTPIAPVTPVTPIFAPSEPSTPVFAPSEPIFAPSVPSAPIYSNTGCYTMSVTNMNPIGSPSGMIYLAYTDCCNGQVYNFAIEPQQTLDNIHTEVYTFRTPGLVESKVTEYVCTTKDGRVPKQTLPEPPQYDEPIAQPIERIKTPVEPPYSAPPYVAQPIENLPIMEEPIMGEPIPRPIKQKPIDAIYPPPFMEVPSEPIDCWMRPELCNFGYRPPMNDFPTPRPISYDPPFVKKTMPIYYQPIEVPIERMPIDDYNYDYTPSRRYPVDPLPIYDYTPSRRYPVDPLPIYDYTPRPIFKEPISYQEPIAMPITNIDYSEPTGGGSQFNWNKFMWNSNDLYNEMPLKATRFDINELM
jgi:hypothetical protein